MFVGEQGLAEIARERRELDRAEALWLHKVLAYDRSGAWADAGYVNAAAALRDACQLAPGAASATVTLARKLPEMPTIAAAFGRGEVSRKHVEVLARAWTPERAAALVPIEAQLVEFATGLHPKHFAEVVRRFTDAIDHDGGARSDEQLYARRRLHASVTLDGMVAIDGLLDPESGEVVLGALHAVIDTDRHAGDGRTLPQRRADALVRLCGRPLTDHDTSRRTLPQVTVVADLAAFDPDVAAAARVEAAHVGQLSRATLDRLLCDCEISRVLTDGETVIVDVGRKTRTISPDLWRALVVRDRHCQAPGCDRPPGWCQGHHIVPWPAGGRTDLDNLIMLCWHHHRQRHGDDGNHYSRRNAA
ncbi:MAG TPA: DUF222 domain-containing protein [Acidimicrobiia bacterium]|nr:DUF222 domain-containing protein [Acidimicrobiia bacterium]